MKRVLMIVAALALLILPAGMAFAQDGNSMPNTITVIGYGTAAGEPDTAYLQVGVERQYPELGQAFNETATTMRAVIDALVAAGIDRADIQTTNINVYPQDRYDSSGMNPTRVFQVSNIVQIKIRDVSQIEAVITAAFDAGATTLYNLNFGIEDTTALMSEARAAAVEDARARANDLATALGLTVGAPISVREGSVGGGVPIPYGLGGGMAAMEMSASQPVSQGQLTLSAQVEITFVLE